eukprot:8644545-Pyramimonas_sp.AAC.1
MPGPWIKEVQKVPAHLYVEEEGISPEQRSPTQGNVSADDAAKRGARRHPTANPDALEQVKRATQISRAVVALVTKLLPRRPRLDLSSARCVRPQQQEHGN